MPIASQIAGAVANRAVHVLLRFFAVNFSYRPSLRAKLRTADGFLGFTVGFRTETETIEQYLRFAKGRVKVTGRRPNDVDACLIFHDEAALWKMLRLPPHEIMHLLMRGEMRTEGNLTYLSLFSHFTALLQQSFGSRNELPQVPPPLSATVSPGARKERLASERMPNTPFLADPYLSRYGLEDFPRLRQFLQAHFAVQPEICAERPALLTAWFRANGFEVDAAGRPWNPVLRQAHAFKHLMEHKQPLVREGDLLAGTTTAKEVGVVIYPDAHGTLIWGELSTVGQRPLNPYRLSAETARILHKDVFPFWTKRNFREWVRERHHEPLCQRIDDRFAVYFLWKTVALSHTVPDFPRLLTRGVAGSLPI